MAHVRTCCEVFCGCTAQEIGSEIPEMSVLLAHKSTRLCLLEFCISLFAISCSNLRGFRQSLSRPKSKKSLRFVWFVRMRHVLSRCNKFTSQLILLSFVSVKIQIVYCQPVRAPADTFGLPHFRVKTSVNFCDRTHTVSIVFRYV